MGSYPFILLSIQKDPKDKTQKPSYLRDVINGNYFFGPEDDKSPIKKLNISYLKYLENGNGNYFFGAESPKPDTKPTAEHVTSLHDKIIMRNLVLGEIQNLLKAKCSRKLVHGRIPMDRFQSDSPIPNCFRYPQLSSPREFPIDYPCLELNGDFDRPACLKALGLQDRETSRLPEYGFSLDSDTSGLMVPVGLDGVRNVWNYNLEKEIQLLSTFLDKYIIVAMDTEFPGTVCQAVGRAHNSQSDSDRNYENIRCNVNMLQLIQLGITLMDEDGNTPPGIGSWQFNFEFDTRIDCFARSSIELLQNAGLEFDKHALIGIKPEKFAKLISKSGLIVSDKISWVSFHSGYDFAYLYRIIIGQTLPDTSAEFFEAIMWLFPKFYDVKYLIQFCYGLSGGLQHIGQMLNIQHKGIPHQAGSDTYLTGQIFIKIIKTYLRNGYDHHHGKIYGFDSKHMLRFRQKVSTKRIAGDFYSLVQFFQKYGMHKDNINELFSLLVRAKAQIQSSFCTNITTDGETLRDCQISSTA